MIKVQNMLGSVFKYHFAFSLLLTQKSPLWYLKLCVTLKELRLFWNVLLLKIETWLFRLPALCRWMKYELGLRQQSRNFSFKQNPTFSNRILWGYLLQISLLLTAVGIKLFFPHVSVGFIVLPNMYHLNTMPVKHEYSLCHGGENRWELKPSY